MPTTTPITITNEKSLTPSPPNMYSTMTTRNTVIDAKMVRVSVWFTLSLIMCSVRIGLLPRTSRIRSKTTIVSLTE